MAESVDHIAGDVPDDWGVVRPARTVGIPHWCHPPWPVGDVRPAVVPVDHNTPRDRVHSRSRATACRTSQDRHDPTAKQSNLVL